MGAMCNQSIGDFPQAAWGLARMGAAAVAADAGSRIHAIHGAQK
jgi:hypothetical protein